MGTEFAATLIRSVEVRRHNGQCGHGPWMAVGEAPEWVGDRIADRIAESAAESGRVEQGGSGWVWRKA